MMKYLTTSGLLLLLTLGATRPVEALSCVRPPDQIVLQPPKDNQQLAAGAPLLVYGVNRAPSAQLRLFDLKRKRRVSVKVTRHDHINLIVLYPRRPLIAGRRYQLRNGRTVLREFVAAKGTKAVGPPQLKGAKVIFGAKTRMAWHGYEYVPGSVELQIEGERKPAAVGFEARYTPSRQGARASRRMSRFSLPFAAKLAFSRGELCPRWGTGHAPVAGGYDLRITLVGEDGTLGKTLKLTGWVQPAEAAQPGRP